MMVVVVLLASLLLPMMCACAVPQRPTLPNCVVLSRDPDFFLYWRPDTANGRMEFETYGFGLHGYTSFGLLNASAAKAHTPGVELFFQYAAWSDCPDGCIVDAQATAHCVKEKAESAIINGTVAYDEGYVNPRTGEASGVLYTHFWRDLVVEGGVDAAIDLSAGNAVPWAVQSEAVTQAFPYHSDRGIVASVNWSAPAWEHICSLLPPIPKRPTLANCVVLSRDPDYFLYWNVSADSEDTIEFETYAFGVAGYSAFGAMNSSAAAFHGSNSELWLSYAPWAQCRDGCLVDGVATAHCLKRNSDNSTINATVIYEEDFVNPATQEVTGALYTHFWRKVSTGNAQDAFIDTKNGNSVPWALLRTQATKDFDFHSDYGTTTAYWSKPSWESVCSLVTPAVASSTSSAAGHASEGSSDCWGSKIRGSWASSNGVIALEWQMNENNTAMTFTLTGKTRGWISFGINTENLMKNADKYTGWVNDSTGDLTVLDTWCVGRVIPNPDSDLGGRNDVLNPTGYQNATHTVMKFERLVDTGDQYDYVLENKNVYLLWAIFSRDGMDAHSYEIHGPFAGMDYGGVLVNFLSCAPVPVMPSETVFFLKNPAQAISFTVACFLVIAALFYWPRLACRSLSRRAEAPDADGPKERQLLINADHDFQAPGAPSAWMSLRSACTTRVAYTWPLWSLFVAGLYVALCLIWAGYWAFKWPHGDLIDSCARALGHVTSASMLVTVLPSVRNSIVLWFTGEPFERSLIFHRWVGRWTFLVLVAHTILFCVSRGKGVIWTAGKIVEPQLYGLIGLGFCCIIIATSFDRIRRRFFTFFYTAHFMFIPFYIFAALHNRKFILFGILSLVLWLLDRIVRLAWGAVPRRATEITVLGGGEVIRLRWPRARFSCYEPGQYVFLNFPQLSLLEWHPFTLTNGPREQLLEVNIKKLGTHTKAMLAKLPQYGDVWVRTDGPYGRMMIPHTSHHTLVLVAGGIGVTPMISLLRDIYGVTPNESSLKPEFGKLRQVELHWGVRNYEQYMWFKDLLDQIASSVKLYTDSVPLFVHKIYFDEPIDDKALLGQSSALVNGRMNWRELLENAEYKSKGNSVGVCVCGPTPVVYGIWDIVSSMKRQGLRVELHYESFIF